MVRKKSVKKVVRKPSKKVSKKVSKKKVVKKMNLKSKCIFVSIEKKMDIAKKNFSFFFALFIVTVVLYKISTQDLYENLFGVFSVIFGFISLAFLIIILMFIFSKFFKKNKIV